ncbi:MAG: NAD(P)/FAD-dependent oxidoreductase [Burkholderiales bacterium]|nr:MAG: NAD(P)/FAD-dependent oxidoreductase [Burkholderiales bacterium]
MRHVIIGNGPAGVIAAETIRKHRPSDPIVLIGDEPEPPYSRMAIPYLLTGGIDESGTYLRKDPEHWKRLEVQMVTGRVSAVEAAGRSATLADGSKHAFDACLIATGSVPLQPPIPGIDAPGVHPCWTLQDARAIMKRAAKGARVLQIGAGFIGCIILDALALRGVQLTVVEMGDRMVPRMMGPQAGGMIKAWCESRGVRVFTSTKVKALEPSSTGIRAELSDGRSEEFDLVIQATGVKPNVAFLAGSGIKCDSGVLVDEGMQSSVPGIFAAGDCAEAYDAASGQTVVSAIQPNAVDQAYVAAVNMAGGQARARGVTQINVLDMLGLVWASFGRWQGVPGGEHAELVDADAFRYLRLEVDGDRVVGANSLGMTDHVGVLRGLVEQGVHLGHWKELLKDNPSRVMQAYLAAAQSQSDWQTRSRGTVR